MGRSFTNGTDRVLLSTSQKMHILGWGEGQLRASRGPVNREGAVPTAPACTSEVRQSSDGPCWHEEHSTF